MVEQRGEVQRAGRARVGLGQGVGAHGRAHPAHHPHRLHAVAHHVPHHQAEPAVGERVGLEPVAADVHVGRSGAVERGDLAVADDRQVLLHHAALQRFGDAAVLLPHLGVDDQLGDDASAGVEQLPLVRAGQPDRLEDGGHRAEYDAFGRAQRHRVHRHGLERFQGLAKGRGQAGFAADVDERGRQAEHGAAGGVELVGVEFGQRPFLFRGHAELRLEFELSVVVEEDADDVRAVELGDHGDRLGEQFAQFRARGEPFDQGVDPVELPDLAVEFALDLAELLDELPVDGLVDDGRGVGQHRAVGGAHRDGVDRDGPVAGFAVVGVLGRRDGPVLAEAAFDRQAAGGDRASVGQRDPPPVELHPPAALVHGERVEELPGPRVGQQRAAVGAHRHHPDRELVEDRPERRRGRVRLRRPLGLRAGGDRREPRDLGRAAFGGKGFRRHPSQATETWPRGMPGAANGGPRAVPGAAPEPRRGPGAAGFSAGR